MKYNNLATYPSVCDTLLQYSDYMLYTNIHIDILWNNMDSLLVSFPFQYTEKMQYSMQSQSQRLS